MSPLGLEITSIKVKRVDAADAILKAHVSIVINGVLAVHNLKVIESDRGLFVSMPARRGRDGAFSDIVHPTSDAARAALEAMVLRAYRGEDWRPPDGAGMVAWVWPPPDILVGRSARALPGGPSGLP